MPESFARPVKVGSVVSLAEEEAMANAASAVGSKAASVAVAPSDDEPRGAAASVANSAVAGSVVSFAAEEVVASVTKSALALETGGNVPDASNAPSQAASCAKPPGSHAPSAAAASNAQDGPE